MSEALTLTEAAEKLLPAVQVDEQGSSESYSRNNHAQKRKGKWLSLEEGAAELAARMAEKPAPVKQGKSSMKNEASLTLSEAADALVKSDEPETYPDTSEAVARQEQATRAVENAAGVYVQRSQELQAFVAQAAQAFPDVGSQLDVMKLDSARGAAFVQAQQHAQALAAKVNQAHAQFMGSFGSLFAAEDGVFLARNPGWSEEDSRRVHDMLVELGLPPHEILQLWTTLTAIDVSDPRALALVRLAAGDQAAGGDEILRALVSVGFKEDEVQAIIDGKTVVHMRDYRIQELLLKASQNVHETREDKEAA